MIDTTHSEKTVARKGNATASYYHESKRIVCIADSACFHHLESALYELSRYVSGAQ